MTDLPIIPIRPGELAVQRVEAEAALALHAIEQPLRGVYQRGGVLVRVHRVRQGWTDQHGVARRAGAPMITPVETGFLNCLLSEAAVWTKYDGRSKKEVLANPPKDVVPALLAGPWEVIRPLSGVLETPALMPDGRLLTGVGRYDEATGFLLDTMPIAPIEPSRRAAEAALKTLVQVFAEFPFVGPVDLAVALAAPLSGLQASIIDATPMITLDAPAAGAGKTLLAEVASLTATGRRPAAMPQAADEAEDKKRLLAILMSGDPMALIDNVDRPVESAALCAIITGTEYEDRLLGANRKVRLPTRVLWLVTGNNLRIAGDLTRRTIACRIDPKCERPDERRFKLDLHQEVPRRRAELVHAALTIMASYIAAGRPKPLRPFGNFEAWSRMVREPLAWLGMADPCDSREVLLTGDPERETLGALMHAWWTCFQDQPQTANQVIHATDTISPQTLALKEAIASAVVDQRRYATPAIGLGYYLKSKADRVHGGRCFVRSSLDKHAGAAQWQLLEC